MRVLPTLVLLILVLAAPPGALSDAAHAAEPESAAIERLPLEWGDGSVAGALPEVVEVSFGLAASGDLPEGVVEPRRGVVALAAAPGGGVAVLLDMAAGSERVWFDTDLDGAVADERAVSWQREGLRWAATAVVRVPIDDAHVRVPVRLWRGAFRPDDEFLVEARVHRWGAAPVGGALRLVALEDGDGDLRFLASGPDRVLVDLDADGSLDVRPGSPEFVPLGSVIELDGRRLRVTAAEDGHELRLVEVLPPPEFPAPGAALAPGAGSFEDLFATFDRERRGATAEERAPTLRALGALGTTEALLVLERAAREDLDADVRVVAAESIGNPAFAVPGRERAFSIARTAPSAVACAGVRALYRIGGEELTAHLADLVIDARPAVAGEAARHLAAIDSSEARGAIVRGVRDRPSPKARLAVYEGAASGPLGVPQAARDAAAADAHAPLRLRAIRDAQGSSVPKARALLHAAAESLAPSDDATELLPLLARCGDAACVDALASIGASRSRPQALALLQRMSDATTSQRLVAALADDRDEVRAFAAEALGGRGDTRIVGRLLERLEEERALFVREAVLVALGDLGDVRALGALRRATDDEEGGGARAFYGVVATPWLRGVAEVQSALRSGMRDPGWRVRELAVGSVGVVGDPALVHAVRDALGDDHRLVRAAAAEVLGDLRERQSVRPLIDVLRTERNQPVREVVGRSLFRLTGINLYDGTDLWLKWWEENGDTFVVPHEIPVLPPASVGGTAAPEPSRFYGIAIETQSVVFVIDQSGSMAGPAGSFLRPGETALVSKFDTAVRELLGAVEALEDGVDVNVILFESGVRSWRRTPERLSPSTRTALKRYMAKQQPSGATNLYDAVERGLRMRGIETIVLLSDGAPSHGKIRDPNAIVAAVHELNERRGVVIHCVSIGGGSALLRRLADDNDGEYVAR